MKAVPCNLVLKMFIYLQIRKAKYIYLQIRKAKYIHLQIRKAKYLKRNLMGVIWLGDKE
jgi:hypothetical protein